MSRNTFETEDAKKKLHAILASLAAKPKSTEALAADVGLALTSLPKYMNYLRGGGRWNAPKRVYIIDYDYTRAARVPLYAPGDLPDAQFVSSEDSMRRMKNDEEFFSERKAALAKRIVPPSRLVDPFLAWIPPRATEYREAA